MNALKKKTGPYQIFLVLGVVWVIGVLVIFQNSNVWPLGFLFLIMGFVGLASKRKAGRG
jgi:Na+/melibiose symporter-like transporter